MRQPPALALALSLAALLGASGCLAEDHLVEGEPTAFVFRSMRLERIVRGASPGFDLDGAATTAADARGCHHDDRTAPDGTEGIDNQVGELLPLLDIAAEGALDAFLQNAIDEGRLLLLPEVVQRGPSTHFSLLRGKDAPLVGSDGRLLEYQTFALDPAKTVLGTFDAAVVRGDLRAGGRLGAGPFDVDFLVVVFDILYELRLWGARFELAVDADGEGRGVLAGGARIEDLRRLAAVAGERADVDLLGILGTALEDLADLQFDASVGHCQALSVVATFETIPAFVRR